MLRSTTFRHIRQRNLAHWNRLRDRKRIHMGRNFGYSGRTDVSIVGSRYRMLMLDLLLLLGLLLLQVVLGTHLLVCSWWAVVFPRSANGSHRVYQADLVPNRVWR